ncbi:MAG: GxxExxY protein [Phycisphaerales bacterium]|nr:MAG: GxxExxY protein [Phycisphaerales bacterium]
MSPSPAAPPASTNSRPTPSAPPSAHASRTCRSSPSPPTSATPWPASAPCRPAPRPWRSSTRPCPRASTAAPRPPTSAPAPKRSATPDSAACSSAPPPSAARTRPSCSAPWINKLTRSHATINRSFPPDPLPADGDNPVQHQQRRPAVPTEDLDPQLTDVSRQVIGFAIEAHKSLGPGFDRDVYEKALTLELDEAGIGYKLNHSVPIHYKEKPVGAHNVGLLVDGRFAVEVMAVPREIDGLDRTRLRAQLRAADLELGLIINFGERRLKDGLVRVLNPDKLNAMRADRGEHHDDDHGSDE